MVTVLDIWTKILDQSWELEVKYCDFMKSFDKVPHDRLKLKIKSYGICGNILAWIEDFLQGKRIKLL